ncbi:MAG TPA: MOSC N-terminal beta barrel domain-containing protein [Longimicrobiales bacterium]|nr:MOSC N-terminal beta barrel domain-containing protein [Longimicrobiales bacterium]
MTRLAGLYIYPLKSAGGIAVDEVAVNEVGLEWDRRWILVDDAGRFMSQRTHPAMALLRVALDDAALLVTVKDDPDRGTLELPLARPDLYDGHEEFHIWHTGRYAVDCGAGPAAWFSNVMGIACRVMRAVEPPGRDPLDASGKVCAGFADAEPALVISIASLEDLNARLAEPLHMNRFRPNLVLDGLPPYGEDRLGRVRIGDVIVCGVRPCPRCALTTVDQDTGTAGKEPLRTLATYRRLPDGSVGFGMNVRFENAGVLKLGTPLSASAI